MSKTMPSDDQSEDDVTRQCVLYYSNPNFLMEQETTTLQFGHDEEEYDDEAELDDDDDDIDDVRDQTELQSSTTFTGRPNHHRKHDRKLGTLPGGGGAGGEGSMADMASSIDDPEVVVESAYVGYFDSDVMENSKSQRSSQHRLVGGLCGGGKLRAVWNCQHGVISCLQSRPCLFFVYVVVVLVLLSSFVSLILIGVLVVDPYTRVAKFTNATCRTQDVSFAKDEQSCSCGKGCNSKYRCLRIQVQYDTWNQTSPLAILYEDETSLNRQCSYYPPCRSSRAENEEAVQAYERRFGRIGMTYGCWHNPVVQKEVIQHKRFTMYHVINGIVWSAFLFLSSVVFLVFTLKKKGCFR